MQYLISAPPKTGKTMYVVELIFKILHKEPHRHVVTNIIGIDIPGVMSVNSSVDNPLDWRDYPNGTVFIFDEAHEHPAFSKDDLINDIKIDEKPFDLEISKIALNPLTTALEKKQKESEINKKKKLALHRKKEEVRDIARSLTLHGHFGFDIYFLTQDVRRMNDIALAATNEHIILRRLWGWKACLVYKFAEVQRSFSGTSRRNAISMSFYRHKKWLHKYYVSAEQHNTKASVPNFVVIAVLVFLVLGYFIYQKSKTSPFIQKALGNEVPAKQVEPVQRQVTHYTPEQAKGLSAEQLLIKQRVDRCVSDGRTEPQCRDLYDKDYVEQRHKEMAQYQQGLDAKRQTTAYNVNDPYAFVPEEPLQYEIKNKPVFSGCIKYNGKYTAYTEQGTKLAVSADTCKRLIDKNERPYDYFSDKQRQVAQQQQPVASSEYSEIARVRKMEADEQSKDIYSENLLVKGSRNMMSDDHKFKNYENVRQQYEQH